MAKYKQGKLPYEFSDLEPHIDKETMDLHYNTHHFMYVQKLAKIDDVFANKPLHVILNNTALTNELNLNVEQQSHLMKSAGGHYNHTLYFQLMTPSALSKSEKKSLSVIRDIEKQWKSMDEFFKSFEHKVSSLFGSGWVWLIYVQGEEKILISIDKNYGVLSAPSADKGMVKEFYPGQFYIVITANQESPIMFSEYFSPLIAFDVWEHAYYKKYSNNKLEYLSNYWEVLDWKTVNQIYSECSLQNKPLAITEDGYINISSHEEE